MMVPEPVGRLQVLVRERVVGPHERERRLVVEVAALLPDVLVLAGEQTHRLPPAVAPLLPPGHPALGLLHLPLSLAIPAWVRNVWPVRQRGEGFQAQLTAGFLAGRRHGLDRHVRTGTAAIPPVRFVAQRDGLAAAHHWPAPTHGAAPDLGQNQGPVLPSGAV